MVRTSRTHRSSPADRRPAARVLVRIAAAKDGLLDGTVYIGSGAHQSCHALAALYSHEPLVLDLARLLTGGGHSDYVRESAAAALVAIAEEPRRTTIRAPRRRP